MKTTNQKSKTLNKGPKFFQGNLFDFAQPPSRGGGIFQGPNLEETYATLAPERVLKKTTMSLGRDEEKEKTDNLDWKPSNLFWEDVVSPGKNKTNKTHLTGDPHLYITKYFFHPDPWQNHPIWLEHIFSNGLGTQPPTRQLIKPYWNFTGFLGDPHLPPNWKVLYFGDGTEHSTCTLSDFSLAVGAQGHTETWPPLLRAANRGDQKEAPSGKELWDIELISLKKLKVRLRL